LGGATVEARWRVEDFFDFVPTGTYISPLVASDTHAPEPFPMITWSWIFRSTSCAASTSCRVSRKSSLDGAGSPDGWLWIRISAEAPSRRAGPSTSRGGTRVADWVAVDTRCASKWRLWALRMSGQKCSVV